MKAHVAWSVCGVPGSGIRTCPWCLSKLLDTYPSCCVALLILDTGRENWSYFNLMSPVLLTPMDHLPLSERRQETEVEWMGRRVDGKQKGQ